MPASTSFGDTGPAAAKIMGRCPARFSPTALSKATLACPPVTAAWSKQMTTLSGVSVMQGPAQDDDEST